MKSLYIHIPFCKRKCYYCDFVSYAGKEHLIEDYVEAVEREISSPRPDGHPSPSLMERGMNSDDSRKKRVSTIYFGGGTPTLLSENQIIKILEAVRTNLNVDLQAEITIEANPGTVTYEKLKALRRAGINRLSLGAQSFNDRELKCLGRIHTVSEIYESFEAARSAGFENINLDLIFALPNQNLEDWKKNLKEAIALEPEHLSTYNLEVEGWPDRPGEEEELAMYEYAIDHLTSCGFEHYEISNFAKPGKRCLHNLNYWQNGNYLGIGAGAHSHINGKRWGNPDSVEVYNGRVTHPLDDSPNATDQRETLFLGLRLLDGLSLNNFRGFEKEVTELIKDGLLIKDDHHYKLSRQGLYLANLVFEKFI